ncbi:MAG: HEAT repeat domain-containing protein [Myxococcota bacterium]
MPLRLGRKTTPSQLTIEEDSEGHVRLELSHGKRHVQRHLAISAGSNVSIETIPVDRRARIAKIQLTERSGTTMEILVTVDDDGFPQVLWHGKTSWSGDPGERQRHEVEVRGRNEGAGQDVIVWEHHERIRLCDGSWSGLRPRAVHVPSLTLRPVVRASRHVGSAHRVSQSHALHPVRRLPRLRAIASSSELGQPSDPLLRSPPTALTDADPTTSWTEAQGGPGQGEFVTLEWRAGPLDARAIRLTQPEHEHQGHLREAILITEDGLLGTLSIPESSEDHWAVLPSGTRFRCLSLVLTEIDYADHVPAAQVRTSIAEVEVLSELELDADATSRLGQALIEDAPHGRQAAQTLLDLEAEGMREIHQAWTELSAPQRLNVIQLLGDRTIDSAEARQLLSRASRDPDHATRVHANRQLAVLGAAQFLESVAAGGGPAGRDAILALCDVAEGGAALRSLFREPDGPGQPHLRNALRCHARRHGPPDQNELTDLGPSEKTALSLVYASVESTKTLAQTLLAQAIIHLERFEDRYRAVRAARLLPPHPVVDSFLLGEMQQEEWMQRREALKALWLRQSPGLSPALARAFEDPYPRVRLEAVTLLSESELLSDSKAQERLAKLAANDPFPIVRSAAVRRLRPIHQDLLESSLDDRYGEVRQAALRRLTVLKRRSAWPVVLERLEDRSEWLSNRVASIDYLKDTCISDAAPALLRLVRRGMHPEAQTMDRDLAVRALNGLARLPNTDLSAILREARGGPHELKQAAEAIRDDLPPRCSLD